VSHLAERYFTCHDSIFSELFSRKLLGRKDIEDALKRLDSLIQEETKMVATEILKVATQGKDSM
jgi:hypothetical protein